MANTKNSNTKSSRKKNGPPRLTTAAIAVVCLAAVLLLRPGGSAGQQPTEDKDSGVQIISEGESLVIPAAGVTETASFYPVEVNGTQMEILAVRDSSGQIRTAFNTCQVCYSSGRGYYVQSGSYLVCQNCGNRFTVDHVEVESGGCNPWPIFPEDKTEDGESIIISYDFLNESREIFARWKS